MEWSDKMMICKADFEELFPETFPARHDERAGQPNPDCLARWEDDGGRTAPARLRYRPFEVAWSGRSLRSVSCDAIRLAPLDT